ncbi:hypothetical protein PAPYR_12531 [Paratrimastix pyriformis]|uniref:G-protein coupled receptors family 2 profile 2 domain-containing protein n=1 Tax=Paratrimastix pyriformis TaxID=342808 RepID=A0ABQ8U1Q1_9EUKA|nr:hypothetical protein PAPYR_12531 [Paratrimastix pyriformis]
MAAVGGVDQLTNNIFAVVGSTLSIAGTLVVFVSFFCRKRLKSPVIRFVFYESIADFFTPWAAFLAIGGTAQHPGSFWCFLDGTLRQLFYLASFQFNFLISFNMLWIMGLGKPALGLWFEVVSVTMVWVNALILLILCFAFNKIGPSGNWCWVTDKYWQMGVFYVPLFIVVLFDVFAFVVVLAKLIRSHKFNLGQKQRTKHSLRRVILYPVLFCIIHFFRIANRITEWSTGKSNSAFQIGHGLISPLQGFLNAVIYVNLFHYLRRCCCGCCKKDSGKESPDEFPDQILEQTGWQLSTNPLRPTAFPALVLPRGTVVGTGNAAATPGATALPVLPPSTTSARTVPAAGGAGQLPFIVLGGDIRTPPHPDQPDEFDPEADSNL